MKRTTILSCAVLLLTAMTAVAQGWQPLPSGFAADLLDICFVSPNSGWAVGTNGTIIHTTSGGISWSLQENPAEGAWIHSVFFLADGLNGWACGSGGNIYHTGDGGDNWVIQPLEDPTSADINAICFVDELHGWAGGNAGLMLHTADGGETWQTQTTNIIYGIYDLCFINQQVGWCVAGLAKVAYTNSAGDNWIEQGTPHSWQDYYGVDFRNSYNGICVGWGGVVARTGSGGNNWEEVETGVGTLTDVEYHSADHTWAVGENGIIIYSSNDGVDWVEQVSEVENHLAAVSFCDGIAWAAGSDGMILRNGDLEGIKPPLATATTIELMRNYPNPFNPVTTIEFELLQPQLIHLRVTNLQGAVVARLADEWLPAGRHSFSFDGSALPSAVYICHLETEDARQDIRMTLIK